MAEKSTTAHKALGDIAPALAEVTDNVLFDYAGWPTASTALGIVRKVWEETGA